MTLRQLHNFDSSDYGANYFTVWWDWKQEESEAKITFRSWCFGVCFVWGKVM